MLAELFKLIAADGSETKIKGYRRSEKKVGVQRFDSKKAGIKNLPAKVDLRPLMTPVENQGDTNSCAANATAGAYEYLIKRHQGKKQDISRLYVYYNARYMDDEDNIEDEGATLSSVIEGLKEYGACTEDTWTFDPDLVNEEPDQDAYDEGSGFLVESAKAVPTDLTAWKTALAAGNPIIFGLRLYNSFDKHRKPGLVPPPSSSETGRGSHGGHAMLCVGYSDPDEVFIVRNSWGREWGDKGYCYIPYRYMMDEEHNFDDSWIIERLEILPPDEESWSDDEESVLEEVSSALADMDEEDYEVFLEEMGDYPFEQRLALLFLKAVGADGEISEDEIEVVKEYLEPVLEATGGNSNASGIIKQAKRLLKNQDLLEESIQLIWEWFDSDVLASITQQLEEAASADGFSKAERKFVDSLITQWQSLDEESEEEEEEEEEEYEDDEDDEEYEEDEEEYEDEEEEYEEDEEE
jgi:hypothetical protein